MELVLALLLRHIQSILSLGLAFWFVGSLDIPIKVGWLDAAAFLEAAGRCGANLAGPFAGVSFVGS